MITNGNQTSCLYHQLHVTSITETYSKSILCFQENIFRGLKKPGDKSPTKQNYIIVEVYPKDLCILWHVNLCIKKYNTVEKQKEKLKILHRTFAINKISSWEK